MSTLREVRQGIKDTIDDRSYPGLTVYATVPETIKVPAVVIEPDKSQQACFGGGQMINLDLVVLVSRADSGRGQDELDDYVGLHGDDSIAQWLRTHANLGLGDVDSIVKSMENYGAKFNIGGIDYIGAVLKTFVITQGS